MSVRDAINGLTREQLHRDGHVTRGPGLEELEAEQREIQRKDEYIVALRRERMGVEAELARLKGMRPELRQWAPGDDLARGEPPSAREGVAAAEGRLRGHRRRDRQSRGAIARMGAGRLAAPWGQPGGPARPPGA